MSFIWMLIQLKKIEKMKLMIKSKNKNELYSPIEVLNYSELLILQWFQIWVLWFIVFLHLSSHLNVLTLQLKRWKWMKFSESYHIILFSHLIVSFLTFKLIFIPQQKVNETNEILSNLCYLSVDLINFLLCLT